MNICPARESWDGSSPDNAVGALSELLGHIVPLVHDELLVEHLEHLATLQIRHDGEWWGASDADDERLIKAERLEKNKRTAQSTRQRMRCLAAKSLSPSPADAMQCDEVRFDLCWVLKADDEIRLDLAGQIRIL